MSVSVLLLTPAVLTLASASVDASPLSTPTNAVLKFDVGADPFYAERDDPLRQNISLYLPFLKYYGIVYYSSDLFQQENLRLHERTEDVRHLANVV